MILCECCDHCLNNLVSAFIHLRAPAEIKAGAALRRRIRFEDDDDLITGRVHRRFELRFVRGAKSIQNRRVQIRPVQDLHVVPLSIATF